MGIDKNVNHYSDLGQVLCGKYHLVKQPYQITIPGYSQSSEEDSVENLKH